MMVVVGLGRRKEGQVVAGVSIQSAEDGQRNPQPNGGNVGPHDQRPHKNRHQIWKNVLERVWINACDWNGRLPFVVEFVEPFVEKTMMKQSENKRCFQELKWTKLLT